MAAGWEDNNKYGGSILFKIYVTDYEYESLRYEEAVMKTIDCEFVGLQCKTEDELIEKLQDADGIIVQYAQITERVLRALPKLKVISRYGVGFDSVDIEAAAKLGIPVCNVPDYGTHEVSTQAMTLALDLLRKIKLLDTDVTGGGWDYKIAVPIKRTTELTFGLAAFGRIAKMTAQKAAAFGFKVIACDPRLDDSVFKEGGVERVTFDELLTRSDILSCHMPLSKETKHAFDKEAFAKMKKGSIFVNTARGGLVDESALIAAIESGHLDSAGLDVCESEPLSADSKLRTLPNVVITPHIAWYSEEAAVDLRTKAAENITIVLNGNPARNVVNGL